VDTKKEILPALLIGTDKIMPNNKKFYFLPGIVEMHFLPAIPPEGDAELLKEKTFKLMLENLELINK
jgi:1-acyl-sn-glycerol-3-phosphate acyltransferase